MVGDKELDTGFRCWSCKEFTTLRARIAELEARIVWLECKAQVNAVPVSEAKAQGVVMPERAVIREVFMRNGFTIREGQSDLKPYVYAAAEELLRLSAPVQQVSVPDGSTKMQWPEIVALVNEVLGCEAHKYPCERGSIGHEMTGINFNSLARIIDRVRYAAAPAAPAADAGHVFYGMDGNHP